MRSASFDEMQLEAQRHAAHLLKQQSSSSAEDRSTEGGFLQVPQAAHSQRSHSFDSAAASVGSDDSGTFLEVPRRPGVKMRRSSATKTPPPCIHCLYLEEYERRMSAEQRYFIDHRELSTLSYSYTSSEGENESREQGDNENDQDDDDGTDAEDVEADEEEEEATLGASASNILEEYFDDAALEMDIRLSGASSSIDESRARLPRQARRHTIGSSVTTSEDEGLEESDHGSPHFGNMLLPPAPTTPCGITFTLSPTNGADDFPPFPYAFPIDPGSPPASPSFSLSVCGSPVMELFPPPPPVSPLELLPSCTLDIPPLPPPPAFSCNAPDEEFAVPPSPSAQRPRRRSISRQEAIFVEPTGNSLENVSHADNEVKSSIDAIDSVDEVSTVATCGSPTAAKHALVVRDIYLAVPDLRRDRAASVDSCFSKVSSSGKTEELQPSEDGCFLTVPNINATRSRSVDIVLPTDEQARYKALAMTGNAGIYG